MIACVQRRQAGLLFFFFQAEDGIRDLTVTGVQTCALPIYRALTIIKSRGTQHSNQVRELVLSAKGPELADVYSSGGEVLMGTLRWEKEAEERARKLQRHAEFSQKRRELQFAEADIAARIAALQLGIGRASCR